MESYRTTSPIVKLYPLEVSNDNGDQHITPDSQPEQDDAPITLRTLLPNPPVCGHGEKLTPRPYRRCWNGQGHCHRPQRM